jgi:RNA polymerase sigma-70 factor (ECF subfamily)
LQIVRKLHSFRGDAAFSTWLYRIAVNAAQSYRRKRALRDTAPLPEPLEDFREDGSHRTPVKRWLSQPNQRAFDQEAHEVIEQAIAGLPETYHDVFVLADVEDLPTAEVARMLGQSVAAVKSRVHRARLLMRRALTPYFEERAA